RIWNQGARCGAADTLKAAGIRQIDHMWTTHYHGDHVGALLALAKQFPIMHFYDHGKPHANDRIVSAAYLSSYEELSQGKRTVVEPGDKVKIQPPSNVLFWIVTVVNAPRDLTDVRLADRFQCRVCVVGAWSGSHRNLQRPTGGHRRRCLKATHSKERTERHP